MVAELITAPEAAEDITEYYRMIEESAMRDDEEFAKEAFSRFLGREGAKDSNGPQLRIKKSSNRGAAISGLPGPASPKSERDIVNEASRVIQDAIAHKTAKCQFLQRRVVLLLIDAYMYAGPEVWQASINWLGQHPFHTIARIHGEYACQVLHSNEFSWLASA